MRCIIINDGIICIIVYNLTDAFLMLSAVSFSILGLELTRAE